MKEYLNRRFLQKVGAFVIAVVLSTFGLVQILDYYKYEHIFKNGVVFSFFLIIILLIVVFIFYYTENRPKKASVISALHNELKELLKNGEYQTILRRRKDFSRTLWIEGKPNERIQLGKIAEVASVRLKDKHTQIGILIDDLGWTLVTMGKFKEAISYIEHGIEIANELEDYYWISKGHRHLAGIEVEAKDEKGAFKEMKTALEFAQNISDEKLKNEMLAGIYYGFSFLHLSLKNYLKAEDFSKKSEDLRSIVGDISRIVKIHSLKGKIAELKGETKKAKDFYREGLEDAKKIGRTDEMIRNYLGLSRIFDKENDNSKSIEYLNSAKKLLDQTPIPYRIDEKAIKLQQLKK